MLVLIVLCAVGLGLLFFALCRRAEQAPEIPASSPKSYMNDPAFMKQLDDKRKELQAIVNERRPLVERMEALIREHGEDLAALQKIDEWNDLHKKVVALNAKYEETRKRQLVIAGRKLNPGKSEERRMKNEE